MPIFDPDEESVEVRSADESWVPAYWLNGHSMRFVAIWAGRGLHYEIGTRAYMRLKSVAS